MLMVKVIDENIKCYILTNIKILECWCKIVHIKFLLVVWRHVIIWGDHSFLLPSVKVR
jgi:hypothetical protein